MEADVNGRVLIDRLAKEKDIELVGVLDNYLEGNVNGVPVFKPMEVGKLEYDCICLALDQADEAVAQLTGLGVDFFKINTSFLLDKGIGARNLFVENLAREINRHLKGDIAEHACVAEAGVYKGAFAAVINRVFPERKLYLFDTFEGFSQQDIEQEMRMEKAVNPLSQQSYFSETAEDIVMRKMVHPQNVVIKKGYVPNTFEGIEEEFCFVNLDMDLYKPTIEALEWFWPRMVKGGGILVHDFYNDYSFPNLKRAVMEFADKEQARYFPIGDGMSVFIPKMGR